MTIRPGEIYEVALPPAGTHFFVVLSREELNRGKQVLAAMITSTKFNVRSRLPNCVVLHSDEFGMTQDCIVQCENVVAIETSELRGELVSRLDGATMREVLKALGYVFEGGDKGTGAYMEYAPVPFVCAALCLCCPLCLCGGGPTLPRPRNGPPDLTSGNPLDQGVPVPDRYEYRWVDAADFPNLDREFYDETQAALESLGFRWLGDRENLTLTKAFPKLRTFVRAMVSADGTISSYHYHIQAITPKGTRNIQTIELGSELSDGTFLTTSNSLQSAPGTTYPGIDSKRHAAATSPDELLCDHRERLLTARSGLTVTRTASREDDLQFQWRMQALQAKQPTPAQASVDKRLADEELKAESLRALMRRITVSGSLPADSVTPETGRFLALITALKKQWELTFPFVRPLARPAGRLPCSMESTFYAGTAQPSGWHVFLWFQPSDQPSKVDDFTLNVILCADPDSPPGRTDPPKEDFARQSSEGIYRIGGLTQGKDKWWHLKDDDPSQLVPRLIAEWRPTTFADFDIVLRETVADVTRHVAEALRPLKLIEPTDANLTLEAALPFGKCSICNAIIELSRDSLEKWYQKNRPQLRIGDLVPQVCVLCGDELQQGHLVVVRVVPSQLSAKVTIGTPGLIEEVHSGAQPVYSVDLAVEGGLMGRFHRSDLFRVPGRPLNLMTLLNDAIAHWSDTPKQGGGVPT
jgi:mRNA-degrading endonuclease toxin of MazEF toxin-antitoxin module